MSEQAKPGNGKMRERILIIAGTQMVSIHAFNRRQWTQVWAAFYAPQ